MSKEQNCEDTWRCGSDGRRLFSSWGSTEELSNELWGHKKGAASSWNFVDRAEPGVGFGSGGGIVESFCVSEKAAYFAGKAEYRDA